MNLSAANLFQSNIKNLKPIGSNGEYSGHCPFHEDKNPSFSCNIISEFWICHAGCGSGDAADFANLINIDPAPFYKNGSRSIPDKKIINNYSLLCEKDTKKARYYLKYLQNNWDDINTPKPWTKVGCKNITGYDPETQRLTFIHTDTDFNPVNIKWHKSDKGEPGYSIKNHGGCRYYPLGFIDAYDPEKVLVICEGEKDSITLLSKEFQTLTGTTGASSFPKELAKLEPFKIIIIIYDNDVEGISGSKKLALAINGKFPEKDVKLFSWEKNKYKNGYDVTDYFSEGNSKDEFKRLLSNNSRKVQGETSTKLKQIIIPKKESIDIRVHSLKDMLNDSTAPPPSIISDGILQQNGILMVYGSPKVGKSLLACNIALSTAAGVSWFGYRIEKAYRTLIIQAEVNYYPLKDRLASMMILEEYKKAKDYVFITDAKGFDIISEEGQEYINQCILKFKPEVIIFDPLKDYHQKEENSNTDMAIVMQGFRKIVEYFNVSVIIVHHSKKYNDSGSGQNIRGASNIYGSIDSAIELSKNKKGNIIMKFDLRYGKQPNDQYLYFNETTLFFEDAGYYGKNKNEIKLMEIVKKHEPEGIIKTELQLIWETKTGNKKTVFHDTFKKCKPQLEKRGTKLHLLGNVLAL